MSRVIERYRRMPGWSAFALAAIISWVLAAVTGVTGGIAGVFLYDRGNSKGNDLAIFASGVLSVGTFTFVFLFSWIRKWHYEISSRTPLFALLFCLTVSVGVTMFLSAGNWDYYSDFIFVGWIAILFFGLLGLLLSQHFFVRKAK